MAEYITYECQQCGAQDSVENTRGVRIPKACLECDSVTTWDRIGEYQYQ